jgi:hypothetical protein
MTRRQAPIRFLATLFLAAPLLAAPPTPRAQSQISPEVQAGLVRLWSAGSLQELSDMDMAQLRQFLEQKTQLEQMISNIMKAGAESQASLVANLKGS